MARGETYEEFVEKFKPKKTTDDCYTPPEIYEVIKDFCVKEYGLNEADIIRPFKPCGDYKRENYQGKVVVDNPPFSIMTEIINFYAKFGIKYFLFCSCLTAPLNVLYKTKGQFLNIGVGITYENGAIIQTSFCTNLNNDNIFIKNYPNFKAEIERVNERLIQCKKKKITKIQHNDNVLTSALIKEIATAEFKVGFNQIRPFNSEKIQGIKKLFGASFLISDEVAKAKAKAKAKAEAKAVSYELPKFALDILDELNGKKQDKSLFD